MDGRHRSCQSVYRSGRRFPEVPLELLDTTAAVDTPERVRFRYRLAGPGRRAAAWLIDMAIAVAIVIFAMVLISLIAVIPGLFNAGMGLVLVLMFAVQWLYGAFFETLLAGRTPGKLALSLRVVREDGSPGQFPDFLLRNLVRAADFMPMFYGLGVTTMLVDRKLRRLGDLVASTVVVIEERGAVLGGVAIDPPVSEAERQALPPRVDLSRDEIQVIETFLRRRRMLSHERAEELALLFGPKLSERTGITANSWERVLTLAYARATGKDR